MLAVRLADSKEKHSGMGWSDTYAIAVTPNSCSPESLNCWFQNQGAASSGAHFGSHAAPAASTRCERKRTQRAFSPPAAPAPKSGRRSPFRAAAVQAAARLSPAPAETPQCATAHRFGRSVCVRTRDDRAQIRDLKVACTSSYTVLFWRRRHRNCSGRCDGDVTGASNGWTPSRVGRPHVGLSQRRPQSETMRGSLGKRQKHSMSPSVQSQGCRLAGRHLKLGAARA